MKNLLYISLLFFALASCRTAKKTVNIDKSETEITETISESSEHSGELNIESKFKGFGVEDFTQSLSWLNWQYADDFSIEINQTDSGYKISGTGTGSATGGQTSQTESTAWQSEYNLKYTQLENEFSDYKFKTDQRIKEFSKEKKVEKESWTPSTGILMSVVLLIIVGITLFITSKKLR